jgi:D-tagatose-1,6-bisphosphate aldolase subunit GatZ/KbaZ
LQQPQASSRKSALERLSDLKTDHCTGRRRGTYAVCSAHREVLTAAMERARSEGTDLLIEATANQVNQFGGYTGMTPAAFSTYVRDLATTAAFPLDRIVLGADHLGPQTWKSEPAERAMANALALVRQCIAAGFRKLHLDTGGGCADDPSPESSPRVAALRAAALCRAAEDAHDRLDPGHSPPLYVIGAEVPPPGGDLRDPERLEVTRPAAVRETIERTHACFGKAGLESAWERVIGIVVQPGVEFGDDVVAGYRSERARPLSDLHAQLPGIMTYEIHSTDYQSPAALARLTRDHFTLLKVGPCLTYAVRETIFALAHIESEWLAGRSGAQPSGIREALEAAMLENPVHWRSHFKDSSDPKYLRAFSYRDRVRYYWSHPRVAGALQRLFDNLSRPAPPSLLSQYVPDLFPAVRSGACAPDPISLIRRRVQQALVPYSMACR